jgi:hypothetical protein
VDISPVATSSVSHFVTFITAMKAIDIPDKMPRSHARKLADEQLRPIVQVTHPSPLMVRTSQGKCGGPLGLTGSQPQLPDFHRT